jgi:hypothetical protein
MSIDPAARMAVNIVMMMVLAASADGLREGEVDVDGFVIVVYEDQVVGHGNDVADARIVIEDLEGFDAVAGTMQVKKHGPARLLGLGTRSRSSEIRSVVRRVVRTGHS